MNNITPQTFAMLAAALLLTACSDSESTTRIAKLETDVAALQKDMNELKALFSRGSRQSATATKMREMRSLREWAQQLQNKTRKDIVDLLGPPDGTSNDGYRMYYSGRILNPVTQTQETLWLDFGDEFRKSETLTDIGQDINTKPVQQVLRGQ